MRPLNEGLVLLHMLAFCLPIKLLPLQITFPTDYYQPQSRS
jgi:hypothetical protein